MGQKNHEEILTLELTKEEVLMLQVLTEHHGGGYKWEIGIFERLRAKALEAYKKPTLSKENFLKQLEEERAYWGGLGLEFEERMVRAKSHELHFLYKVEGADNQLTYAEDEESNVFVCRGGEYV